MKIVRKILVGLLIILIILQFFRPEKNIAKGAQPNELSMHYTMPPDVKPILDKACNDCHTNTTRYPWYAEMQPFAWWLEEHVVGGKQHLNFSEFATYSPRKQYHKMEEVIEQVEKNEMPLKSYTFAHTDAKLTQDEKQKIMDWAGSVMDTMKTRYPIDSLIRKKK